MKKILIEGMTRNLGGVETFVHLLYSVLRQEWQVDFITVDDSIPFEDEFLQNGCKIYHITPRYKNAKQFCRDIDQVFEKEHYDVFWFNKTTLSSIHTLKAAKKSGVKRIICHSHQSKNMGSFFTLCMHKINRKRVAKYINGRAACSEVAAEWFFGSHPKGVKIFPNAVDISKYEPDEKKMHDMKKQLGVEDKFVIANVARFAPEKNHKFLISIFDTLSKKENAHLILCGNGELKSGIEQLVEEKGLSEQVSFLGMRRDIPDILQAVDVMVMPSLFEGLPFVLVEAQAAGVPCVVSDTVSEEAKLTDILEYMSLESSEEQWADKILSYKSYVKVSKRAPLESRGFSKEKFKEEVINYLEIQ